MTHLSRDELRRWHERGAAADRDRVVGHLAVCDECVRLYGELMDERQVEVPLSAPPETGAALRAAGYQAYRHASVPGRPARWRWLAAAAAVIVVAIGARVWYGQLPGEPADAVSGFRGTEIRALAPVGPVQGPLAFRWASPVGASAYQVEIVDSAGQVLHTERVEAEAWTPSEALAARLTGGGATYTWTVTALDREGAPIVRSRPQSFSVR